jgi:hypothetical protein
LNALPTQRSDTEMTIPTFKDASERVRNGTATNLDRFIWNWEPKGEDSELFREQLALLLNSEFHAGKVGQLALDADEERARRERAGTIMKDGYEHPPYTEEELKRVEGMRPECAEHTLSQERRMNLMGLFWNPETNQYESKA